MVANIGSLKTAIPYIRAFKNTVFIVKLAGELCHPGPVLENIVEQFSLLYQLGIKLVVVHGGGRQATELSEKMGVSSEFINGRRVTSEEMLEVVKMSFAGAINTDILASCRAHTVPAVGLSGVDAGIISAVRRPPADVENRETGKIERVDYGFVGDIKGVNIEPLKTLIDAGYVPVVSSLAADDAGQVLNVNADTVATKIAIAIGATKYCVLTTVDGVMGRVDDPSTLFSVLTITEAQRLFESDSVSGGMLPKLSTCIDVLKGGVPKVHIINGARPDTLLLEVFTNEGCGTLITKE